MYISHMCTSTVLTAMCRNMYMQRCTYMYMYMRITLTCTCSILILPISGQTETS